MVTNATLLATIRAHSSLNLLTIAGSILVVMDAVPLPQAQIILADNAYIHLLVVKCSQIHEIPRINNGQVTVTAW